jgi:hypothetical protein
MSRPHRPTILVAAFLAGAFVPTSSPRSKAFAATVTPQAVESTVGHTEKKAGQNVFQPGSEGAEFRSVELREVGLGPKGVAMGHWTLLFRGGLVSWRHSDVVEKAAYELGADGAITSTLGTRPDRPARAHYDGRSDRVFWGEMWYERVAP